MCVNQPYSNLVSKLAYLEEGGFKPGRAQFWKLLDIKFPLRKAPDALKKQKKTRKTARGNGRKPQEHPKASPEGPYSAQPKTYTQLGLSPERLCGSLVASRTAVLT